MTKRTLATILLGVSGILAAAACTPSKRDSAPAPPPPGLPSVGFLQLADEPIGTLDRIDTFARDSEKYGVLATRRAADGKSELLAQDGAIEVRIAPPGHYLMPHAVIASGFRAACATEYAARPRGVGPLGPVYELDRGYIPELVCFVNVVGQPAWARLVVARGDADGKPRALWPLFIGPSRVDDDTTQEGALTIVWSRDALWDPTWLSKAGRDASDATLERTIVLGRNGVFGLGAELEFATYLDGAAFVRPQLPKCAPSTCGALWNGVDMLACSKLCAAGESCIDNACRPGACRPMDVATACADDGKQGKRCGAAVDGCGGVVDCGGCFGTETCGGGGVPGHCGTYRMTEARLRQLYGDESYRLCGKFDDLAGGVLDLTSSNTARHGGQECPAGESCRGNLCSRP